jgi:hypothetical protein
METLGSWRLCCNYGIISGMYEQTGEAKICTLKAAGTSAEILNTNQLHQLVNNAINIKEKTIRFLEACLL